MQIHRAYDGGGWVYGTYFDQEPDDINTWWFTDKHGDDYMVSTPEPSVGVQDVHDKSLFLHDIIRHTRGVGVVRYMHGAFYVVWRTPAQPSTPLHELQHYEIIGNLTEERL